MNEEYYPICEVCGCEGEYFYYDKFGTFVGCDLCVTKKEYCEVEKG